MRACAACGQPTPIRWRNPIGGSHPDCRVHVAGPVISSREYRRSCPGYIVDRRQACTDCGIELVRGRWAVFFLEGALVLGRHDGPRRPIFNYYRCDDEQPRCGNAEASTAERSVEASRHTERQTA